MLRALRSGGQGASQYAGPRSGRLVRVLATRLTGWSSVLRSRTGKLCMSMRSKMMRPCGGSLAVPRGMRNSAMFDPMGGAAMRASASWTSTRPRVCVVPKNWPYTLGMHVALAGRLCGHRTNAIVSSLTPLVAKVSMRSYA